MSELPGGRMDHRPVHFFWLLDCSSSMSVNGKISALNFAVREAIPEMRQVASDNAAAQLMVRVDHFFQRGPVARPGTDTDRGLPVVRCWNHRDH